MKSTEEYLNEINAKGLADMLWDLVKVPSPTGQERKAVLKYAELLKNVGAEVELDEFFPESPAVIGRLKGNRAGKCIQLAGHIDNINKSHQEPKRENDIISGRGSADMKNGLSGILEVVRVLSKNGCDFPGEVLITVFGQHETPVGNQKPLMRMLEHGIKGDAAIVAESFSESTIVVAKGQAIWNIQLRREGRVCHELSRSPEMDNLLKSVVKVIEFIQKKNYKLWARPHEYNKLGAETLFIGQVHYGDFYNRVPTECKLQGTYRWHPNNSFEQVQKDMVKNLNKLHLPGNISFDISWILSGESYEVDSDEPVIQALRNSCEAVTGRKWHFGGTSVVTDACRISRTG
ncbi:MAG TPA: M20/M25/M40 family metallo-hydrolase, partial [Sedimentisphaerales bacterium]|nr:M20/M25/M40 family metallo-hydrolase [Sedimentisphaerales bacterium]